MGLSMRQQSAVAATVIGLTGIGLGLAAGFAVVYWLGVVAGIAAVLAAYLAYLFVNRIVVTEEQTQALAAQVEQLETAVASQIQARMNAEEEARKANLRAAESELTNALNTRDTSTASGELCDPETGLFGEAYFLVTVEQRISAARRHLRPVSIAVVRTS